MNYNHATWLCCQLGAREHYAIPRALHQIRQLKVLITDTWINHHHPLNWLPKSYFANLRGRYHSELKNAPIKAFNESQIAWELAKTKQNLYGWERIIVRNIWWQDQVLKKIKKYNLPDKNITLFAYSYAALKLFKYAKKRGWKIVLGQIDPGVIEEKIIYKETQKHQHLQTMLSTIPHHYWTDWRQECNLADRIIVNSNWSSQALQQTGISSNKIKIIPLAYQASDTALKFKRTYPLQFSHQRPLKVLFLGQIIIRKGVAAILEAIEILTNKAIEFWFVGKIQIKLPKTIKNNPKVKWIGAVSRNKTSLYYQQADVFLFPTHSDGFGLTQLEAQSWKLPLITSQFCGEVVKDKINGLILPNITGKAIAEALTFCLNHPQKLSNFSHNSTEILADFSLNKLAQELNNITND